MVIDLDESQRAAVYAPFDRNVLVLAGAGSGKTRVLTARYMRLVEQGVSPSEIMAVTFTNKAANEMKERIVKSLSIPEGELGFMGTFHSICVRLLRKYGSDIGVRSNFTICDEYCTMNILRQLLERDLNFLASNMSEYVANAAEKISLYKSNMLSPADVQVSSVSYDMDRLAKLYALYQAKLKECNMLDFDDLILQGIELFRRSVKGREFGSSIHYLLVDEYQDTNKAQCAWVSALNALGARVFAVGDDDQSIYRFRGADVGNILRFKDDFNALVFYLSRNYRSTSSIVSSAMAVISNNQARFRKMVSAIRELGEPLTLIEPESQEHEAKVVAEMVKGLVDSGTKPSDIAILSRTFRPLAFIEQQLAIRGVPHVVVGARRLLSVSSINDLKWAIDLAVNEWDLVAAKALLENYVTGVGPKTSAKFVDWCSQMRIPPVEAVLKHIHKMPQKMGKVIANATALFSLIESLAQMTAAQAVATVWDKIISPVLDDSGIKKAERAVVALLEAIQDNDVQDVADLASMLALVRDSDVGRNGDGVRVMTIHASKGLEFRHVFLVSALEGLIPHSAEMHSEEGVEDERRLFYVAMTRAMDNLYISCPKFRHVGAYSPWAPPLIAEPSRFVSEIPTDRLVKMPEYFVSMIA